MKKLLIVLIASSVTHTVSADSDPVGSDSSLRKNKAVYYFTIGMGTLIGCENCSATGTATGFSVSTVHGVRFGRASVGGGVGYDSYESWKALPLFVSASWDLFGKRNKVFVGMNYGYAYASRNRNFREYGYTDSEGGRMINPLIGYRLQSGQVRIGFSMGFKFQRVFSNYSYPVAYPFPTYSSFAPLPGDSKEIRKDMSRFVLGMTIGW